MTVLLFVILAVSSVIYMATPLLWERYWPFLGGSVVAEIKRAKRESIWAINDIDGEYEMGKLSGDDHSALRAGLKSDLAEVMKREREVLGHGAPHGGEALPENFKRSLLTEVLRICGLNRS
jgi:hypothetical protein